jgi:hypothetical protein
MKGHVAARMRRTLVALLGALLLGAASAGAVSALPHDGENPATTACGDGSHTMYTLGKRNAANPKGSESYYHEQGIPTPIMVGSTKIGEVEIRHSRYCATVWSRVKNLTGATAQVKEALVTYTDSNGGGRVEHWYPTTDTIANNQYGWSNQYRDRASFSARGGIYYNGAWRYAETERTSAWNQFASNYPETPYACNHGSFPCERWPLNASGFSVTRYYKFTGSTASFPKTGGGTLDLRGDYTYLFGEFNNVAAYNPYFYFAQDPADAVVDLTTYVDSPGVGARTQAFQNSNHLYTSAYIKVNTASPLASSDDARALLCHEIDHLMGLHHVWGTYTSGIDNIGSKATCIGMGDPTGPRIDDTSALAAVYSGVVP